MTRDNLFSYRRFKFLKYASILCIASSIAYLIDKPEIVSYGGTPLGYTLGTIGGLLILWLMWLGVRKRQYLGSADDFKGWVSGHIYLGLGLITVATLHTGFQIGVNIHTLAYLLMLLTIGSGVWGVGLYIRYPERMSAVLDKDSADSLVDKIDQLDKAAAKLLGSVADTAMKQLIQKSLTQGVFDTAAQRRKGKVTGCKTNNAVEALKKHLAGEEVFAQLYQNQIQRLRYLQQLRKYFYFRYWLELWLAFHVPLSFGLLASLIAHVVSVFFYW